MRVQDAIRTHLHGGQRLLTPGRAQPFTVDRMDSDGIVLLLGRGQWPTRLTWECLEGLIPYLRDLGGEAPIGGRHQVEGNPGTLDGYLKECIKRTTAGWVAVVLKTAAIVEVVGDRPQRVRLRAEWR